VRAALERLAREQDWGTVPLAMIAQATGYSERHVKRLVRQLNILRTRKGHARDIQGTSKGHEGDIEGTRLGHVWDMKGTSKGHEGDIEGTSKGHAPSLFPTGPGDEICSLVLSLPSVFSPVFDPKILLDPKEKPPPLPPSGGPRARTRRTIPTTHPGFDRWWASYTPSRAHAKPKCLALWRRDGLEERAEEIIAHTLAMQATDQWQDERLIPHALKYLSEQRYTAPPPKPLIRPAAYGMTYTQEETDRWIDEEERWRATL
jgi:hypothetical protein